ncbi:MAG: serine hydrolase domain-containing protein, partial [Planctomycetota bacterium]
MILRRLLVAWSVVALGGPEAVAAQQPAFLGALTTAVKDAAPAALRRHGVPGVAVAMVVDGEVAWAGGFGLADVALGIPMTGDTPMELASVTKPVTAWGVLKLAQAGLLDLDAPIEQYLPGWRLPPSDFDPAGVTPRRILAHAAGLSFGGDPGVEPGMRVPTLEEALDGEGQEGGGLSVAYPPGEAYHYSSKGYMLLEMAIAERSGLPYAEFMTREILAPLGIHDGGFEWTADLLAQAAVGYDWFGNPLPRYRHATHAQGGLITSARGIARFLAASVRGPDGEPPGRGVLSPEWVAQTFEPIDLSDDAAWVGLGYNLDVSTGTLVARKTGDHRGWKSLVVVIPELDAALAILSNSDRAAAGVFADLACPWSEALGGDPLAGLCTQLHMFRNVQLGLAAALAAAALIFGAVLFSRVRDGRRRLSRWPSLWQGVRASLLLLALAAWWVFWYTDTFLTALGYAKTFVTVRLTPWPTAFIWVSWGVTMLAVAAVAVTLTESRPQEGA